MPPRTLAPSRLGMSAVTFIALAASAPLLTLIAVVPAAYADGGGPLVPLVFLALGVLLLVFSSPYAAMVRRAPFAGALSTFVTRGLGRPAGLAAAWVAIASYQAIQLALYGLAAAALSPLMDGVPWWQVAGGCWLLVTLLGLVRIEITGALLALIVLAEIAVTVGYAAANLIEAGRIPAETITPSIVDRPILGLLLVIGAMTFVGFETTGAYAEESMRPRRDPGNATFAAVIVLGMLSAAGAWSMSVAAGPAPIAGLARSQGDQLVFGLAAARLPGWTVTLGRIALLAALVAAALAVHHAMVRYLFALGREHVLPPYLGRTSRRARAPHLASLTQSAMGGLLLLALGRPDTRLAVAGGLGVLALLTATSVAALLHLNRIPDGEGVWTRFVAPSLAAVGLGVVAYLGAGWDRWTVAIAVAALLGLLHALVLRLARPVIYAGIGHAGVPVVVTPTLPEQRHPGAHRPERIDSQPKNS
ncbi:APC family permease [Actinoplanes sp. TBRC 11911]|uniref:APC family permease n=1 Tax=Actinoplanes sp. TBRC 11911 TaxID=2729386 RepID=UPI00145D3499|nr:APC family permease [Actinoplanes sp. TBRC 11911]NMO55025.1 APC family permease [Actinoplanes sp. TBRC 11911]